MRPGLCISPRASSLGQLREKHLRAAAARRVQSVEHSMALENQAAGKLDEAIDREMNREEWRKNP